MTRKTFWEDPYRTELDTTIESVSGPWVTVAETIFFAGGGGQESDAGTIAGLPVLEARREGRELHYALTEGHGLQPEDRVWMAIDWTRRYRLMRLHFAAELVLELVSRQLAGVKKIGAHIAADKARIDFQWPENIAPWLPLIQAETQGLIAADLPVKSGFIDEEGERRCWDIAGFARVGCGGTHLRRTGEVGAIDLRRRNLGRGKERIEIFCP